MTQTRLSLAETCAKLAQMRVLADELALSDDCLLGGQFDYLRERIAALQAICEIDTGA